MTLIRIKKNYFPTGKRKELTTTLAAATYGVSDPNEVSTKLEDMTKHYDLLSKEIINDITKKMLLAAQGEDMKFSNGNLIQSVREIGQCWAERVTDKSRQKAVYVALYGQFDNPGSIQRLAGEVLKKCGMEIDPDDNSAKTDFATRMYTLKLNDKRDDVKKPASLLDYTMKKRGIRGEGNKKIHNTFDPSCVIRISEERKRTEEKKRKKKEQEKKKDEARKSPNNEQSGISSNDSLSNFNDDFSSLSSDDQSKGTDTSLDAITRASTDTGSHSFVRNESTQLERDDTNVAGNELISGENDSTGSLELLEEVEEKSEEEVEEKSAEETLTEETKTYEEEEEKSEEEVEEKSAEETLTENQDEECSKDGKEILDISSSLVDSQKNDETKIKSGTQGKENDDNKQSKPAKHKGNKTNGTKRKQTKTTKRSANKKKQKSASNNNNNSRQCNHDDVLGLHHEIDRTYCNSGARFYRSVCAGCRDLIREVSPSCFYHCCICTSDYVWCGDCHVKRKNNNNSKRKRKVKTISDV